MLFKQETENQINYLDALGRVIGKTVRGYIVL